MMRRVKADLAPFVSEVLDRDGIPYKSAGIGGSEGYVVYKLDVSSRRFTNVVEDAKSEKERLESPLPGIPVLSYRAAMNDSRAKKLLKHYGTHCFIVREAESKKYCEAIADR